MFLLLWGRKYHSNIISGPVFSPERVKAIKVVLNGKNTIYFVLKNLRNVVLKVSLIISGYFFFAKYMENAGIKGKFFLSGVYPEQTKAMDWLILLFLCSVVLSSIIL